MTDTEHTERRLRRALAAVAEQPVAPTGPDAEPRGDGLSPPPPRHQHSRQLVGALTVVVVVAAVALGLVYGPRSSTSRPGPSPATQPTPGPDVIALGPAIGDVSLVAASNGKLWVTGLSPDQGPATLQEFDEDTGKTLSTIRLPDDWPGEIAIGDNAIWLRTQQGEESTHLVKIDATTHQIVVNITLQKDGGLAVTRDAVWTVNGSLGLLRIDPQTGRTIATIPLPGGLYAPLGVTSGPLGVFLGSSYDGSILRVDEQTNTASLVTHIGTQVDQMVELGNSLWVSTATALVEMPVSTGVPNRTVELGAPILGLATDGHSLWVTTDKPKPGADRIDPVSGRITPAALPSGASGYLAVASDPSTGVSWATASSPSASLVRLVPCTAASTSSNPCPSALVTVPDLVGMSTPKATATLSALGLSAAVVNAASSSVPAGTVVATSPVSGTVVSSGTTVTIRISAGPSG